MCLKATISLSQVSTPHVELWAGLDLGMEGCEVINTDPYHGYAVLFSPFSSSKLAFVGSLNYGIKGSGGLLVYEQAPDGFKEFRRWV